MGSSRPGMNQAQVVIGDHPSNSRKFVVDRETFWVSKSQKEVAEWFCVRKHQHGQHYPCFTVTFNKPNGSPFNSPSFTSDGTGYVASDGIKVNPDENKIYGYVVQAHGKDDLDPGGGVKG